MAATIDRIANLQRSAAARPPDHELRPKAPGRGNKPPHAMMVIERGHAGKP
jgi:hypothetical protein